MISGLWTLGLCQFLTGSEISHSLNGTTKAEALCLLLYDARVTRERCLCSFDSSLSEDEGVLTSPLGPDKEVPNTGFAVTLFDGLSSHQGATALVGAL